MMLWRRASMIAALSLLGFAATASAECKWVLWTQTKEPGLLGLWKTAMWGPRGVYDNEEQCSRSPIRGTAGDWLCLPDTVDPRGPKGEAMSHTKP